jgi:hypothetical protein
VPRGGVVNNPQRSVVVVLASIGFGSGVLFTHNVWAVFNGLVSLFCITIAVSILFDPNSWRDRP